MKLEINILNNQKNEKVKIRNVKHIPELKYQLISEIAAVQNGCTVTKNSKKCLFIKNEKIILSATKENFDGGLFILNMAINENASYFGRTLYDYSSYA